MIIAFIGGLAAVAEPDGELGELYPRYCASLEQVIDVEQVRRLGLKWQA